MVSWKVVSQQGQRPARAAVLLLRLLFVPLVARLQGFPQVWMICGPPRSADLLSNTSSWKTLVWVLKSPPRNLSLKWVWCDPHTSSRWQTQCPTTETSGGQGSVPPGAAHSHALLHQHQPQYLKIIWAYFIVEYTVHYGKYSIGTRENLLLWYVVSVTGM